MDCTDCMHLGAKDRQAWKCGARPPAFVGNRGYHRWIRTLDYHSDELPCPDFSPKS